MPRTTIVTLVTRALVRQEQKARRYASNRAGRSVWKKRRLRVLRSGLLEALGNKCAKCGDARKRRLEIDHMDGRTWDLRKMNRYGRWLRYWKEYEGGVRLRCLCRTCNGGYLNNVRNDYPDDLESAHDPENLDPAVPF